MPARLPLRCPRDRHPVVRDRISRVPLRPRSRERAIPNVRLNREMRASPQQQPKSRPGTLHLARREPRPPRRSWCPRRRARRASRARANHRRRNCPVCDRPDLRHTPSHRAFSVPATVRSLVAGDGDQLVQFQSSFAEASACRMQSRTSDSRLCPLRPLAAMQRPIADSRTRLRPSSRPARLGE